MEGSKKGRGQMWNLKEFKGKYFFKKGKYKMA